MEPLTSTTNTVPNKLDITCPRCNGTGKDSWYRWLRCYLCRGYGTVGQAGSRYWRTIKGKR